MAALAIDFGTSNTVICRWDPVTGEAVTWVAPGISRDFSQGSQRVGVVPSLLFVEKTDQVVIGDPVRQQRLGQRDPERYFQGFKRDLLTPYAPPARILDGHTYDAAEVAYQFLRQVIQHLQAAGIPMSQVILTIPVGAPAQYQQWLTGTAQKLNLGGVQILDEATAAALSYALAQPGSLVLVLDFGGGTLDLSLVRLPEAGKPVQVIARTDAYVGGLDIDVWIVEDHLQRWGIPRSDLTPLAWHLLLELGERLKIQLSQGTKARETWFDDQTFMAHELSLTNEQLTAILEANGFLEQIRQSLDEVLQTASYQGIRRSTIDQVILVGGTSQLQPVQTLVKSQFRPGIVQTDHPFTAVAQGALLLSRQIQVQTTLNDSYALRLWDPDRGHPHYLPLFDQGTPYPCEMAEPLILQVASPGQREVQLEVGTVASTSQAEVIYDDQGRMSSRRVIRPQDFRPLSRTALFYLDPPGDPGRDRLQVHFFLDAQRTLRVSMTDLLTQTLVVDQEILGYLT